MANKEAWISGVVVVVLLVLGVYLTNNTTWFESDYNYSMDDGLNDGFDFPVECVSDSDCVKVQEECCPCSSGGKDLCVVKSLEQRYIDNLAKCDKTGLICAQVFNCKINSCACVNGRCAGN